MSGRKRGGRPLLALTLVLLLLLLLALPWVYLRVSVFPWDDYRTLAAENAEPFDFAAFSPEGELTIRLDKADLYSLLLEYAPPERLLEGVSLTRLVKLELEELGFSLQPEEARINLRCKTLGFLHLPLQLRCSLREVGDGLELTPETVYIGPLLHVSAGKLAQRMGNADLVRPYLLSPGEQGAEGVTLRAGKNEALLTLQLPPMLPDLIDLSVMPVSRSLALYGEEDLPPASAAALGPGFAEAFRAAIETGTARELLTSCLAVGDEGVLQLLEEYTAQIPEGYLPDPAEVARQREDALERLAKGQRRYEAPLEALGELLRSGKLTPVPGGFQLQDRPLTLSDLGWTGPEPEAWRPIYICSHQSTHPAGAVSLPHADPEALPSGGETMADAGLMIALPRGETVVLYRTALNELVVAQLPEDSFRAMLQDRRTPTFLTDALPDALFRLLTAAPAEDLMPVYYLLTD